MVLDPKLDQSFLQRTLGPISGKMVHMDHNLGARDGHCF